ncbi:hypothetical protein GCM10023338_21030 [Wohlfahrtiimonas larvae]|uniref:DUF2474 domain-containing protein n=1 Tax=Wohlfahrtiimonas larvae TaxID=1157986 RepID=A0ABP9MW25_9GAMM
MFFEEKFKRKKYISNINQNPEMPQPKIGSLKCQCFWMMGLWSGGVVALYIVVKILKVVMKTIGLY